MPTRPSSNTQFFAAGLLIFGHISIAVGLGFLAAALTWNRLPIGRPLVGAVLGTLVASIGYRMARGNWEGAPVVLYYGAVLGSIYYLAMVAKAITGRYLGPSIPRLAVFVSLSVVLIVSWLWRARGRRRKSKRRLAA